MALAMRCNKGHSYIQPDIVEELPEGAPTCPTCRGEWMAKTSWEKWKNGGILTGDGVFENLEELNRHQRLRESVDLAVRGHNIQAKMTKPNKKHNRNI